MDTVPGRSGLATTLALAAALAAAATILSWHFDRHGARPAERRQMPIHVQLGLTEDEWNAALAQLAERRRVAQIPRDDIDAGLHDAATTALWHAIDEEKRSQQLEEELFKRRLRNGEVRHTPAYIETMKKQGRTTDHFGIPF